MEIASLLIGLSVLSHLIPFMIYLPIFIYYFIKSDGKINIKISAFLFFLFIAMRFSISLFINLEFTTDNKKVIRESDIIFTLVQTPSLEDGSYDVSAVWKVVEDIKEEMSSIANYPKSFVVGCTTNPGDCDQFKDALPESVDVYYNPEFIAQGSIVDDLRHADMVLLGGKG